MDCDYLWIASQYNKQAVKTSLTGKNSFSAMFTFVMIIFLSAKTSITIKGLTDVFHFNEKQTKCNRNNIHEKHKMKNINMPFFLPISVSWSASTTNVFRIHSDKVLCMPLKLSASTWCFDQFQIWPSHPSSISWAFEFQSATRRV